jgi:hypothetical protein
LRLATGVSLSFRAGSKTNRCFDNRDNECKESFCISSPNVPKPEMEAAGCQFSLRIEAAEEAVLAIRVIGNCGAGAKTAALRSLERGNPKTNCERGWFETDPAHGPAG